jgi:hypothetical protein
MPRDYIAYEESTPPPLWVWPIIVGSFIAAAFAVWQDRSATPTAIGVTSALLLVGPLIFWALVGRLHVRVTHTSLVIGFGHLPLIQKHIPFSDIAEIEPVKYRPIVEFGGWGIRWGFGGKRAWTIRGNRAVRLKLRSGKLFYVGSEDPEQLAERIRTAGGGRWGSGGAPE